MLLKLTLAFTLIFIYVSVFAAQTNAFIFSIGLLYENSDNIRLTPTNTVSDNILHELLAIDYNNESATYLAHLNMSVDHQDYQNNSYPEQTTVSSFLELNATLNKNKAYWDTNNRHDKVQTNNSLPNTPNNLENANYFSTGPRIVFFKNKKDSLNASLKYQNFYAQTTENDYSGYIANLLYNRNITRTFSTGLEINYNDKMFDNTTVNTDYSKTDVTINFKKQMKLYKLEVDLGESYINGKESQDYQNSIFRAKYNYQLGEQTILNLSYKRELQDFSGLFATPTPQDGNLSNVGSNIFILEEGVASLVKNIGFSSIILNYTYFSNEYSDPTSNTITNTTSLTLTNNLSTSTSLYFNSLYSGIEYTGLNRNDTNRVYSVGLKRIFSNTYDLTLTAIYTNHGSTNSNFIYNETRISAGGHYYFR